MNWVDLVIIIALLSFALEGSGKSIALEVIDLVSFGLSYLLSLKYYNLMAKVIENNFSLPHSLSNVLGFMAVWFIVEAVFLTLARYLLNRLPPVPAFNGDKLVSAVLSSLRGMIFIATLLILVATFPLQPAVKDAVTSSKIGNLLLSYSYRLEAPIKGIFGGLANDTLSFLTVEPKTNESVNIGFKTDQFYFDAAMEQAMIDLVNKERVSRGIAPLTFETSLQGIAREHSADMFKRGYFSHFSPEGKTVADRAEAAGISYLVIGENLAYAPSLELAHNGLMNSPGHRANILSTDYHHIGIGIANAQVRGIMFTQVFRN